MSDETLSEEQRREVVVVLERWLQRCRVALSAYNEATTGTIAAERRLGIPAVALSAVVATAVFATVENQPALGWRIATGAVAVAAAVLTALQTFLRHQERAEQFRSAARSYGRLRRRIELAILFPPATRESAKAVLDDIAEGLAEAGRGKPNVSQAIWDRAEYKVKGRSDARGLRALRMRLRGALDFGVGARAEQELVQDHDRYFAGLDEAVVVPVSRIRPMSDHSIEPQSVATARQRMRDASTGLRERRAPLDVREGPAGELLLVDGNATFAVALEEGWTTVPVRYVGPRADGRAGTAAAP
jgi:hypothetical protein